MSSLLYDKTLNLRNKIVTPVLAVSVKFYENKSLISSFCLPVDARFIRTVCMRRIR